MSRISPISGSSRITSLLYCRAGSATASSLCLVRPASQLSMGRNSYSSRGSSPSFSKRLMRCALRSIPCSSGHQSGKPCCLISAMARRLCSSRTSCKKSQTLRQRRARACFAMAVGSLSGTISCLWSPHYRILSNRRTPQRTLVTCLMVSGRLEFGMLWMIN